ncbi:MAG: RNA polymerase sigma factor [Deltaproteobacteria bacterium]|nr:RNA polymerase sigma factor [Deltaproteobacteria bacterium]
MESRQDKSISDPRKWVELYGDYLYRYAFARTRNQQVAEDLVQETFLAALNGLQDFQGRSTEKTWLSSIIRQPCKPAEGPIRLSRRAAGSSVPHLHASRVGWNEHGGYHRSA